MHSLISCSFFNLWHRAQGTLLHYHVGNLFSHKKYICIYIHTVLTARVKIWKNFFQTSSKVKIKYRSIWSGYIIKRQFTTAPTGGRISFTNGICIRPLAPQRSQALAFLGPQSKENSQLRLTWATSRPPAAETCTNHLHHAPKDGLQPTEGKN